jgi:uncharacterized protein YndB with AHSA1/START domain
VKWLLIVMGTLAIVFALMAIVGLFVSREHRATSSITLRQPADSVWKVVRDIGGTPAWFSAMEKSERLPDRNGHEVWREKMSGFDVPIIVLESTPSRRLVTQIDPQARAAFGGTWTYELIPDSGGTRVSVTETGWIGNPVFRFMSRFLLGYYGSLDKYLRALAKRFGETAEPQHS